MSMTSAKISRPWTRFRRIFSSHSRFGFDKNLPHSSAATVSNFADVRSAEAYGIANESQHGKKSNQRNERRRSPDSHERNRKARDDDSLSQKLNVGTTTFDKFISDQISAARRSLMVRFAVQSPQHYDDAYYEISKQLENFGVYVVSNFQMVHSPDGQKTFLLLETDSREQLSEFVRRHARSAAADDRFLPCRSRIVHFTAELENGSGNGSFNRKDKKFLKSIPGTDQLALNKALKDCLSIDDQMQTLVNETVLSDSGTRLRFFVASLIEDIFRGVFPLSLCMPFGSTTNGFGNLNSDLDMDFAVEDSSIANLSRSNWLCAFRVKEEDTRKHTQNMIELFGRMIRSCMPYCVNVARISHARVPIVKFTHDACGFECDLTFDNVTGAAFAKMLWIYSRVDYRIQPLVFTIRRWAAALKLTSEIAGSWITNFQLICLIVYFLQSRPLPSGHTLPSMRTLRRLATSGEKYGIIGSPEQLSSLIYNDRPKSRKQDSKTTNQESLRDLLREFFLFYGHSFAFDRFGINLEIGSAVEKTDSNQPLFIDNPLETNHNIAKNVSDQELHRFRSCARKALKIMESKHLIGRNSAKGGSWGLLALCDPMVYENIQDSPEAAQSSGVLLVDNVKIDI